MVHGRFCGLSRENRLRGGVGRIPFGIRAKTLFSSFSLNASDQRSLKKASFGYARLLAVRPQEAIRRSSVGFIALSAAA